MLKKIITIMLTLSGTLVFGLPENIPDDVPEGVIEVMREIETDPDARFGLNQLKRPRWVPDSVNISDIRTGYPINTYKFRNMGDVLDTCSKETSFDSLIEPTTTWWFPVYNKNDFMYYIKVLKKGNNFKAYGAGKAHQNIWNKEVAKIKRYTKNKKNSPVLVQHSHLKLLYFPKRKGNRIYPNIGMIGNELKKRSRKYNQGFFGSNEVIEHLIKEWDRSREGRERWRKRHPETFKNRKGEKK